MRVALNNLIILKIIFNGEILQLTFKLNLNEGLELEN
jgi:hypothetical protein